MAVLMIIQGILGAVSGALKIASAFRKEQVSLPVYAGKGMGFWDFYSMSNIDRLTVPYDLAPQHIRNIVIPDIINRTASESLARFREDLVGELEDMADYGELAVAGNNRALTSASYSSNSGKLFFYIIGLTPKKAIIGDDIGVVFETMRCEVTMTMAQDWMLVCNMEAKFMSAKSSLELQYLPTAIDPNKVVDAIAIAMAPVVLGLVTVPGSFMTVMQGVLKNRDQLEGLQIPDDMQQTIDQAWAQVMQRQEQRDTVYQQGVDELGKGMVTLVQGFGK